jgi:aminoglycoside phosphotransferase (APT) family kinase protein
MMTRPAPDLIDAVLRGEGGAEGLRAFLTVAEADPAVAHLAESRARVKVTPGKRLTVSYAADPPVEVVWRAGHPDPEVRVSPADDDFPQLARLVDAEVARRIVSDARGEPIASCAVDTIRYRPGQRHVLRYTPADGAPGVIVKLKADLDGAHAYAVAQAFARWAQQCDEPVASVPPLLHLAADDAVVTGVVDGVPLTDRLGDPAAPDWLATAGRAFRALHHTDEFGALSLPHKAIDGALRAAVHAGRTYAAFTRDGQQHLDAVAALARRAAANTPETDAVVVHGDAKADHLWISADRLTFIDVDSAARAEPAAELGKFLADLDFHLADDPATRDELGAAVLAGYELPAAARARVAMHEAIALVRIAFHRVAITDLRWEERTHALLEHARHLLNGVTA